MCVYRMELSSYCRLPYSKSPFAMVLCIFFLDIMSHNSSLISNYHDPLGILCVFPSGRMQLKSLCSLISPFIPHTRPTHFNYLFFILSSMVFSCFQSPTNVLVFSLFTIHLNFPFILFVY